MKAPLRIERVAKSFGARTVLKDVSFSAQAGHVTALLGPNGAGKSTLIACATGLDVPDAGDIYVGDVRAASSAAARARVGVMLQSGGLPAAVGPARFLRYIQRLYRDPLPADELMATLGIDAFAHTAMRRLSGGQRQRVAFAAAIIGQPDVVFLDEPSAGMDAVARDVMYTEIERLTARGAAVLLTTHNMTEAENLASRVVILSSGRVVAQGTPSDLTSTLGAGTTTIRVLGEATEAEALSRYWQSSSAIPVRTRGTTVEFDGYLSASDLRDVLNWVVGKGLDVGQVTMRAATLEEAVLQLAAPQTPVYEDVPR